MWKPRLSPRSESKAGSDSNHLQRPEFGFLGRSKKKPFAPSSGECHIRSDSVPDLRLFPSPNDAGSRSARLKPDPPEREFILVILCSPSCKFQSAQFSFCADSPPSSDSSSHRRCMVHVSIGFWPPAVLTGHLVTSRIPIAPRFAFPVHTAILPFTYSRQRPPRK